MVNKKLPVLFSITTYLASSITSVFVNNYLSKIQKEDDVKNEFFSLYEGIKHLWPLIISFNFTLIFGNLCLNTLNSIFL
ncbi:hypothetical protein YYG_04861 [Plasmodium vinckei petteri]|uniref:Uncharacterized protein n=1 Tax=Plasmodium vinckei petteri TaxID=138298 RepID=W7A9S6_PLAVN|nr:hypothetical protein YYG_04861 [Plasmodium vinckei petteri]